jgi:hypothetical protein
MGTELFRAKRRMAILRTSLEAKHLTFLPAQHFVIDERKTNEMHFQSKPYI